jgi:hypothetical protein
MLAERDRSVDELVQGTRATFPAISQQLKLLTLAGGDKLLSIARIIETAEEQEANAEPPAAT